MIRTLFLLFFLLSCDLHDRYPPKGDFCEIELNPAPCLFVDFREKILDLGEEKIPLQMINRVHYTFSYKERSFEMGVLGEHRLYIKELGNSAKERTFHRRRK